MRKMKFGLRKPRAKTKGNAVLDKIRNAKTKEEVDAALEAGKLFKLASPDTMRKWAKAAASKAAELANHPLPEGSTVLQAV